MGLGYSICQSFEEVYFREEGFILGFELSVEIESCCTCAGVAQDNSIGVDHRHDHEDDTEWGKFYCSRRGYNSGEKQRSLMMVEIRRELLVSLGCTLPVTITTRFLAASSPLPTMTIGMLMPVRVLPKTATSACPLISCRSCNN